MINAFVTSIRQVVGTYNYELAPTRIGVASIDFEYIFLCILVIMTIWFIYRMLLSVIVRSK